MDKPRYQPRRPAHARKKFELSKNEWRHFVFMTLYESGGESGPDETKLSLSSRIQKNAGNQRPSVSDPTLNEVLKELVEEEELSASPFRKPGGRGASIRYSLTEKGKETLQHILLLPMTVGNAVALLENINAQLRILEGKLALRDVDIAGLERQIAELGKKIEQAARVEKVLAAFDTFMEELRRFNVQR